LVLLASQHAASSLSYDFDILSPRDMTTIDTAATNQNQTVVVDQIEQQPREEQQQKLQDEDKGEEEETFDLICYYSTI